jgi:type II secretory pathway component PulC
MLAPFTDFAAILERPLFAPSRRPTPVEKAATVAIESRYRLQGVVSVGNARHALIAPVTGGAALELSEGDALEGWSVKTIESDRIVLTSPAGEATLAFGHPTPPESKKP